MEIPREVMALAESGQTIMAVRRWRELEPGRTLREYYMPLQGLHPSDPAEGPRKVVVRADDLELLMNRMWIVTGHSDERAQAAVQRLKEALA